MFFFNYTISYRFTFHQIVRKTFLTRHVQEFTIHDYSLIQKNACSSHYLSQHNILCYHFNIIHLLFPYVIDVCGLIADYSPTYCFKSIIFTIITTLSFIDKKDSIVLSSHPANHINVWISSCDKSMPRRNFNIFSVCRF